MQRFLVFKAVGLFYKATEYCFKMTPVGVFFFVSSWVYFDESRFLIASLLFGMARCTRLICPCPVFQIWHQPVFQGAQECSFCLRIAFRNHILGTMLISTGLSLFLTVFSGPSREIHTFEKKKMLDSFQRYYHSFPFIHY